MRSSVVWVVVLASMSLASCVEDYASASGFWIGFLVGLVTYGVWDMFIRRDDGDTTGVPSYLVEEMSVKAARELAECERRADAAEAKGAELETKLDQLQYEYDRLRFDLDGR